MEDLSAHTTGARRRTRATVVAPTGRFRRAVTLAEGEQPTDLAWAATLRQASLRRGLTGQTPEHPLDITRADFRRKERRRPCDQLIVLVVDTSDSMGDGAEVRMKAAKGAVLAILRKAYEHRSHVALVAFGGETASLILPPTRSVSLARRKLERLPTGGATPFAGGLQLAWQLIRHERLKNSALRPTLVLISDGEANVPLVPGMPTFRELFALARTIGQEHMPIVLIDAASRRANPIEMRRLASELRARYLRVHDLKPKHVLQALSDDGGAAP